MGYRINAFKGISWIGLLRASTRAITFVRLAILARILNPVQFGIFGIATLMLSFLEVITETGINVFLVQEKEIKKFIDSALIVSILRGILISSFLFILAPLIGNFFNSSGSIPLLRLIALVPLIRGFINPSIIYIQKDIKFHKEFYLRTTLFLVDAVTAIVTAFITKSALSFVYGLIVSAVVEVICSYLFFRPYPGFNFEFTKIKYIISRSWWVTVTGIFTFLADNGDNGAVGKLLGANALGVYGVAYKLSTLPISEITNTVNMVVFPVYSKFPDDKKRLLKAFSRVTLVTTILASFLGIIVFIFAKEIVLVIVGKNWLSAVPAIRVLAIYGVLRTIFGNFAPLALAIQKQDYVAKAILFRLIVLFLLIVPFTVKYGLVGAGTAVFISMFFEIGIIFFYLNKIFSK